MIMAVNPTALRSTDASFGSSNRKLSASVRSSFMTPLALSGWILTTVPMGSASEPASGSKNWNVVSQQSSDWQCGPRSCQNGGDESFSV